MIIDLLILNIMISYAIISFENLLNYKDEIIGFFMSFF